MRYNKEAQYATTRLCRRLVEAAVLVVYHTRMLGYTHTYFHPLLHWAKLYWTVPRYTVAHCSTEHQNGKKKEKKIERKSWIGCTVMHHYTFERLRYSWYAVVSNIVALCGVSENKKRTGQRQNGRTRRAFTNRCLFNGTTMLSLKWN